MEQFAVIFILTLGVFMMTKAETQCSFSSMQLGCATPHPEGFVQVSMDPVTPTQVPAAVSLHTQHGVPAIVLFDGNSTEKTNNITANITSVNGNLHLSSYDTITLETTNNTGIILEGKVRLWLSGLDDSEGNTPVCLMLNGTSLGCVTQLSARDKTAVELWTNVSIVMSAFIVGAIAGVIIGVVIYRQRAKRSAYERTESDQNIEMNTQNA